MKSLYHHIKTHYRKPLTHAKGIYFSNAMVNEDTRECQNEVDVENKENGKIFQNSRKWKM